MHLPIVALAALIFIYGGAALALLLNTIFRRRSSSAMLSDSEWSSSSTAAAYDLAPTLSRNGSSARLLGPATRADDLSLDMKSGPPPLYTASLDSTHFLTSTAD
jgi:hypothetical protein